MTDYYGTGTTGIGNIGGDSTGRTVNLKYTKAMGIDIYVKGGDVFSFDIEVSSKYSPDNLNLDVIPRVDVTGALYDLQNTIKTIAPSVGGGGGGGGGGGSRLIVNDNNWQNVSQFDFMQNFQ
jgi:hypothetical protein